MRGNSETLPNYWENNNASQFRSMRTIHHPAQKPPQSSVPRSESRNNAPRGPACCSMMHSAPLDKVFGWVDR